MLNQSYVDQLFHRLKNLDKDIENTETLLRMTKEARADVFAEWNKASRLLAQQYRQHKIAVYNVKFSVKSIQTFLALHTNDHGHELFPIRTHSEYQWSSRKAISFDDYTKRKFDKEQKICINCGDLTPKMQVQLQKILSRHFWVDCEDWNHAHLTVRPLAYESAEKAA